MQTRRGQRVRALLAALACIGGATVACGDDDKTGCERLCDNVSQLCQTETIEGCVEECIAQSRSDREGTLNAIQCSDGANTCGTVQSCLSGAGATGGVSPGGAGGVGPGGTGGTPTAGCSNTCQTSFDNECDDGGPNSLYDLCPLGTDCSDCGPRTGGGSGGTSSTLCSDACATSFDMECDDGGPGALYNLCPLGTDCSDCGVRTGPGG
jgi:hypothetical protein